MRNARSTYLLIGLFFAGMLALWGLEHAGVLTEAERAHRRDRVLPDLVDLDPAGVRRVELVRGDERMVFERRGPRSWWFREPFDAEADPAGVERLIATLKGLRKSPEAGTLGGEASKYGLAEPAAVARVWAGDGTGEPTATLEIGRVVQEERFVRAGPRAGVEVVPRRALEIADRPAVDWRQTAPIPPSTPPIVEASIRRPGLDATVHRGERGAWRLTEPVRFPADAPAVEKMIAALGSIRVDPQSGGFAADHVEDFAPFGLDAPAARVELRPSGSDEALVLEVGSAPADQPGRRYIRKADGRSVFAVDGRFLGELPGDLRSLRSRRVADLNMPAAVRVEVDSPRGAFRIERDRAGWALRSPTEARADRAQLDALLRAVEELQVSEFFEPGTIPDVGLDPASVRIRVWEGDPSAATEGGGPPEGDPTFALDLGRHDLLRKVVFGRVAGDSAILALPEAFLGSLPSTAYAFRDLDLPAVQPTSVVGLRVVRPARTTVLEPADPASAPNRWKMVEPVKSEADARAVTAALARLADLRASAFVADAEGDLSRFGLEPPLMEVRWELRTTPGASATSGSLRIGQAVADAPGKHYGTLTGFPAVFTIEVERLLPFTAEFHETRVLDFRPEKVRRLVIRTETRELAYRRRTVPLGVPSDWTPEPGTPSEGVDLSRFNNLIEGLSELRADRFITYDGRFPEELGLGDPRLDVRVTFDGDAPPARLRIGAALGDLYVCAAAGDGDSGAVFTLPARVWEELIRGAEGGLPPIPPLPFAP